MAKAFSKLITQNDVQNILAHINLGDDAHKEITQAEFDQLTPEEQDDGTIYFITDGVSTNIFVDDNTPVGMIAPYGGTTDPAYWLICDGRAVSREAYAELFAAIGTTYGVGNGSTTFNIPDLRGRIAMGTNADFAMGDMNDSTAKDAIIPYHRHSIPSLSGIAASNGAHTHTINGYLAKGTYTSWTIDNVEKLTGTPFVTNSAGAHTHSVSTNVNDTGYVGTAGNVTNGNLQPYTVTNYIIKASSALSENQSQLDFFYPVGSYYETSNIEFNPNTQWGGTWILETEGQVHVSAGENYIVNKALENESDGGSSTVTLTSSQIPAHTHKVVGGFFWKPWGSADIVNETIASVTTSTSGSHFYNASTDSNSNTSGGSAHENMPPYVIVNRWHRIA